LELATAEKDWSTLLIVAVAVVVGVIFVMILGYCCCGGGDSSKQKTMKMTKGNGKVDGKVEPTPTPPVKKQAKDKKKKQ